MRIGVLELLRSQSSRRWDTRVYAHLITRQFASIMPQAVSVWCRELGHQVFYETYFGQKGPKQLLPDDLDVVFISTYTQASPLAYALAKLYRKEGTLTVIGGPHAKQFPDDCLRFFDIVVRDCDKTLITDILSSTPRGEIVSSGRTLKNIPSVQERMPEIRISNFWRGKPYASTTISLLSSIGCPYSCNFCVDWNNPHVLLPPDLLEADLRFILKNFPGVLVGFHDPNFGVRFDEVLAVLQRVPHDGRKRYMMESSLSMLRESRLKDLRDNGFLYVIPGIESWTAYSNKAGTGSKTNGRGKMDQVAEHVKLVHQYISGIQANLMFGLDTDEGDEPVQLTKEFITQVPFAWPAISNPIPFGETPLYDQYLREGRILTSMPFAYYNVPYLVMTLKNYTPIAYYERLIEVLSHSTSGSAVFERLRANSGKIRFAHVARVIGIRQMIGRLRVMMQLMKTDRQFRAFHEGESQVLPDYYYRQYDSLLGPYATLLSPDDRRPVLPGMRHALPQTTSDRLSEQRPSGHPANLKFYSES